MSHEKQISDILMHVLTAVTNPDLDSDSQWGYGAGEHSTVTLRTKSGKGEVLIELEQKQDILSTTIVVGTWNGGCGWSCIKYTSFRWSKLNTQYNLIKNQFINALQIASEKAKKKRDLENIANFNNSIRKALPSYGDSILLGDDK